MALSDAEYKELIESLVDEYITHRLGRVRRSQASFFNAPTNETFEEPWERVQLLMRRLRLINVANDLSGYDSEALNLAGQVAEAVRWNEHLLERIT